MSEKIAAGLPLTEQEEKDYLVRKGKQIAIAFQMYCIDWGFLPQEDTILEDIYPYMRNNRLFMRPGTDQVIFRYIAPDAGSWSDLQDRAGIVIGILDPGEYDWVIEIYADSHVKRVPRE